VAARILALLAAVAMVAGAVAVRGAMDDDEERTTTALRLVCSTELAAVCDALAADGRSDVRATVEAAADTAARLTAVGQGEDAGLDGWLVAGPWPAIVDEAREREAKDTLLDDGAVLARSPLVLAVWPDRDTVLKRHCEGGTVGWKCLGENAGEQWSSIAGGDARWGPVKPGLPPVSTATGLAVLGAATTAWFGDRPVASSADLEEGAYQDWLDRLLRAVPRNTAATVETALQRGPAAFDAVGTIEAEAGPLLARTARPVKPRLLYPEPVATADVVLGTTGGRAAELLRELVSGAAGRRALAAAGWRVDGETLAPGLDPTRRLPDGSGLPSAGVLEALRRRAGTIR
jgi:hypothetical protein